MYVTISGYFCVVLCLMGHSLELLSLGNYTVNFDDNDRNINVSTTSHYYNNRTIIGPMN